MSCQFVFAFFDLTPQFGVGNFFRYDVLDFWSTLTAHGGHTFRLFSKNLFNSDAAHTENGLQGIMKWKFKKTWRPWFFEYLLNNGKSRISYHFQMIRKQPQKYPILAKIGRMIEFDLLNNIFSEIKVIASPSRPSDVIPQKLLFQRPLALFF